MVEEKPEIKIEDLQKQLEELKKQKDEYLAGWQRERADFLNYKKDEMERIGEFLKYSSEEFVLKILPILDNFEIAEKNLSEEAKKDAKIQGLLLIKKQLSDFIKSLGVEEIKTIGETFNPNFHEVVGEEKIEGKTLGIILEEIQKGYQINGHLLRPAKVKITK